MNWLRLTLPVAFISAFAELGYAIINNSVFPPYITHGLGIDTAIMTLIMVPFFVSEVLFKGPLGVLADHWGRKPLMILGPAVSIFTPVLTIMVPYIPHHMNKGYLCLFGVLRLIDGAGAAALWPAMFAYVGDVVHIKKRASAMGLINVTYIMGLALGFLAGGFVDDTFGPVLSGKASFQEQMTALGNMGLLRMAAWRERLHHHHGGSPFHMPQHNVLTHGHEGHGQTILQSGHSAVAAFHTGPLDSAIFHQAHYYPSFYLACILFACATIVSVVAIKGKVKPQPSPDGAAADPHAAPVTWQGFIEAMKLIPDMLLLTLTAFFGIGCIAQLVKLFALDEFGLSEIEFGTLILFPACIIALLAVPIGWMSDKWGKVRSVRLGFIMCSLAMWSLIVLSHLPHIRESALIIAGSLLGLGFVVAFPAWMALLTTISEQKSGTIIGAISTAQGIGVLCGALVGGFLYKHASSNPHLAHIAPFVASALFLSVATVLAFTMMHRESQETGAAPT